MLASVLSEGLGLAPKVCAAVQAGGATAAILVMQAVDLVRSGRCRNVLVALGDNRLTGVGRDGTVALLSRIGHPVFEQPFGISVPAAYALVAQRYMADYGTTGEDLADIAVLHRDHAALHPLAHMREPIGREDVLSSRMIASPLHMLDCCLISDGAAAVVVSAEDARADAARPAVRVIGAGQAHTHEHIVAARSLTEFACKDAAARAMAEAGVSHDDIGVLGIYDSFTITLAVQLESMGFVQPGETGRAVAVGVFSRHGKHPLNLHGGLLSFGHSGAAGGMFHVVEVVEQLRGTAGARQADGQKIGFVHNDGGILSAHCSLVLARD
jgi:acetyl-CoA acetyltransferase